MTAQQLKNSILQMAVQGKLVPQDPNDEPASVLLERIRKEKEALVKAGKIKKDKNPSVIFRGADNTPYEKVGNSEPVSIADEIPFEIPDSWEWVRLGTVFQHNTGKALNAINKTGKLLSYITTSNLYWNHFILNKPREMYFTEEEEEKCTVQSGDLLVCEGGDFGRAAIWKESYPMRIQNHIHRLRPYCPVSVEYYYYLFFLYKNTDRIGGKGIGIQGLSSNALHNLLFPLPPVPEQDRIVSKIKELEPLIEAYDVAYSKVETLNKEFPEMLKKSILQQAIQGKLVPQNPNDEPAEVLLSRIRAEKQRLIKEGKIKKDKHESIIFRRDNSHYEKQGDLVRCIDDEIPFDIPSSWSWARCSSLGCMIRGKGIMRADVLPSGLPCIRYGEIYTTYNIAFDKAYSFISEELDSDCLHISTNDIVFTLTGENKVDIAKAVAYIGTSSIATGGDLAFWTAHGMNPLYIVFFMASPYCIEQKRRTATGDIIVHISTDKVGRFLIPVPPLTEQNRIVDSVQNLFAFADTL